MEEYVYASIILFMLLVVMFLRFLKLDKECKKEDYTMLEFKFPLVTHYSLFNSRSEHRTWIDNNKLMIKFKGEQYAFEGIVIEEFSEGHVGTIWQEDLEAKTLRFINNKKQVIEIKTNLLIDKGLAEMVPSK